MKNLTIAIEDDLLKASREYAEEHQTTVNAMVREFLAGVAASQSGDWLEELLQAMRKAKGNSRGWKWNRDEIYDL